MLLTTRFTKQMTRSAKNLALFGILFCYNIVLLVRYDYFKTMLYLVNISFTCLEFKDSLVFCILEDCCLKQKPKKPNTKR